MAAPRPFRRDRLSVRGSRSGPSTEDHRTPIFGIDVPDRCARGSVISRRVLLQALLTAGTAGGAAGPARSRNQPFHVPSEAAPHARTFMQWPASRAVYRDAGHREAVQRTIAAIANRIVDFEPVAMLAAGDLHASARRLLSAAVTLWDIETEDLWCRDSGPLFARDAEGRLVVQHLRFNGWGGKQVHASDSRIAAAVARRLGLPLIETGLTGEPGGVIHDGAGTLIAHASCWANGNRNALPRNVIAERLAQAYGARQVVWAPGLAGHDITDFHIDSLARFSAPGRVLFQHDATAPPEDPFAAAAARTRTVLEAAGFDLVLLPTPAQPRIADHAFVASYANYYLCNGALVVAAFGDAAADEEAQAVLAREFPDRELIAVDADELGLLGGGVHCATQQQPGS